MAAVQVDGRRPGRAVLLRSRCSWRCSGCGCPGYVVTARRARLVLRGYLAAAVFASCLGVLALLGLIPGYDLLTESDRARALFQDPNVFGPFLIPPALILVEEIMRPRVLRHAPADEGAAARHPAGRRAVLLLARRVAEPRRSDCWCWRSCCRCAADYDRAGARRRGGGASLAIVAGAWWRPGPLTSSSSARARRPTTPSVSAASARGWHRPRSTRSGPGRASSSRSPGSRPTASTPARSARRASSACSRCWRCSATRC